MSVDGTVADFGECFPLGVDIVLVSDYVFPVTSLNFFPESIIISFAIDVLAQTLFGIDGVTVE